MRTIVAVIGVVLVLSGCGHVERSVTKGQVADTLNDLSDRKHLKFRGIGAAPTESKDLTQRRAMSRNAALVNGRLQVLAYLKGVTISGGITVAQAMEIGGEIREQADQLVRGAEEETAEYTSDDGCVVTLRIRRADVDKLAEGEGASGRR